MNFAIVLKLVVNLQHLFFFSHSQNHLSFCPMSPVQHFAACMLVKCLPQMCVVFSKLLKKKSVIYSACVLIQNLDSFGLKVFKFEMKLSSGIHQ